MAMTIREQTEKLEGKVLSPFAALSARSRGRARPERQCPLRTAFQRDRDRIIHCKSFRRLQNKTQVFIAPEQDHFRTRLTHTLEVAQIARTISRALRLNEDLTEAIALGHDLGHPPFGHQGEAALERAYRRFDKRARFRHYEQSVRVVEVLEKDGRGLNLTYEVLDGIRRHSKGKEDLPLDRRQGPATLEGRVVMFADRIAYVNHDIDDAIRAGLITPGDLPRSAAELLGTGHRRRITTMVQDMVEHSLGEPAVTMSSEVLEATDVLKDFLFDHVYEASTGAARQIDKVGEVIDALFRLYMREPGLMPGPTQGVSARALARRVCDYIAGMTDRFARQRFIEHFVPEGWRVD